MSPEEAEVMAAVSQVEPERLRTLLAARGRPADFCDADGVSPLQHAAFKGEPALVRALLDRGADVHFGRHEYDYTALHFGALSGNAEVCQMLMDAGVRIGAKNSVGRTAAQMAAFVGNHNVVAKINNFIPKSSITCYFISTGPDFPVLLPPHIINQFHKFILEINLNPVRVVLNLHRSPGLSDYLKEMKNVLEIMSVKEMTRGGENDEVLSFKLHYLSYLVGEIYSIRQKQVRQTEFETCVETFSRKLLKPSRKEGGNCNYQDSFLNEGVRKFPNRQSVIFRQVVCTLAQPDAPSTLSVIDSAVNGQRGFADLMSHCNTCGEEKPAKKCSKCKSVQYCDRECQRLHWFIHKKACTRLANAPAAPVAPPAERGIDANELSRQLQDLVTG